MSTENQTPKTPAATTSKRKPRAAATTTVNKDTVEAPKRSREDVLKAVTGVASICKFEKQLALSNKDIIAKRSAMYAASARIASEENLRHFANLNQSIDFKIAELEDLNITNNQSLKVLQDGFNAKDWIDQLHALRLQKMAIEDNLNIALDIHAEYFE